MILRIMLRCTKCGYESDQKGYLDGTLKSLATWTQINVCYKCKAIDALEIRYIKSKRRW